MTGTTLSSGGWKDGPGARARCRRIHEGTMASLCLLILLFAESVPGVMEVVQPPFAKGTIDEAVTLHCQFVHTKEDIFRQILYWYFTGTDMKKQVVPIKSTGSHEDRLSLSKDRDPFDKSIQMRHLQLNDTARYYCMISLIENVNRDSKTIEGKGTLLFVHGPLSLKMEDNSTSMVCESLVKIVQDVEIVFKEKDFEIPSENITVLEADLGTYKITRRLHLISDTVGPHQNMTITCFLRHSTGGVISQRSMEVSVRLAGRKQIQEEPKLLYVLLFLNRLLILIIILVIFKHKKSRRVTGSKTSCSLK
ncbi:uncharacterized protein [Ambystoma mexicanum]|uniref:uncharacterized protein n=1 Tax=Ambystoma mexicanum TaxID=8296 RepID=UPI0037E78513